MHELAARVLVLYRWVNRNRSNAGNWSSLIQAIASDHPSALFGDNAAVRAKGKLTIWITEDKHRLPVKAQLKVEMGTFDIKLKQVNYPDAARPN
jgi:hypothetical protein